MDLVLVDGKVSDEADHVGVEHRVIRILAVLRLVILVGLCVHKPIKEQAG